MPRASVVIPCYNAERFVEEAVASAQAQTIDDIEIVCVDDGSTDTTLDILKRLAEDDQRIRVISQANQGEGPARDAGLVAATGDWLYFLDADDLMLPSLLEKAIARGEQEDADVVIFRTTMLDDQTGEQHLCDWSFKRDWICEDTFSPRQHPDHVFNSFQNWVHNKLFRGAFVRKHDLHMQHVHRTADLLFTCRALAEAERITLFDTPLYFYRINNAQSAMSTSDFYPLDFYRAFVGLRTSLEEHGTWELYHDSFVNWAIEGIAVNLRFANTYEAYRIIADELEAEGFDLLDITAFPRTKSDIPFYYDLIRPLVEGSPQETLYAIGKSHRDEHGGAETSASRARMRISELEDVVRRSDEMLNQQSERIAELESELSGLRHDLTCVTTSASFKVGRVATFLPRQGLELARKARKRLRRQ